EWLDKDHDFRRLTGRELPAGYTDGYTVRVPFIDTTRYMPFLHREFKERGGQIVTRQLGHISEVLDEGEVVVNCSGLGARTLVDDAAVYPIRGQIVLTENPVKALYLADDTYDAFPVYILSREQHCVLGGTVEDHSWSERPSEASRAAILERCR